MLNEKTYIAQIGLNDADLRLVETVFKLSAELRESYILNTKDLERGCDIIFLNDDSPGAIATWEALKSKGRAATLIKVTSSSEVSTDGLVLARPLSLKKIMTALESVVTRHVNSAAVKTGGRNNSRVLVVDDSYSVRTYMEHKLPQLCSEPLHIEFADSGEAAIEKMKQDEFDVVFLDVMMPGMDGYQVCKWVKAEQSSYVVMLTSKKSPFDKVRGNMSGCNAYITKPPKDEHLQRVLMKGLAESRSRNQSGSVAHASMATSW